MNEHKKRTPPLRGFLVGDDLTPDLANQLNADWFIGGLPERYPNRVEYFRERLPQVNAEYVPVIFEDQVSTAQLEWLGAQKNWKGAICVGNEPGSIYNLTPEWVAQRTVEQVNTILTVHPDAFLALSMGHQNGCPRNSHKEKIWINQVRRSLPPETFAAFKALHFHYYPEQEIPSQLPDLLGRRIAGQATFGEGYNQVLIDRWDHWLENHELADTLELWMSETGTSKRYEDNQALDYLRRVPSLLSPNMKRWAWYAAEAHPHPATIDDPWQFPAYHSALLIRDGQLTALGRAFAEPVR